MKIKKNITRNRRIHRVRNRLQNKPKLSVSKTNKHLYAQIIDNESGKTICGIGTLSKGCKEKYKKKSKEAAKFIGETIAEIAKAKKIKDVVFDRGRYKYHGLIALIAEGARSKGLQF